MLAQHVVEHDAAGIGQVQDHAQPSAAAKGLDGGGAWCIAGVEVTGGDDGVERGRLRRQPDVAAAGAAAPRGLDEVEEPPDKFGIAPPSATRMNGEAVSYTAWHGVLYRHS